MSKLCEAAREAAREILFEAEIEQMIAEIEHYRALGEKPPDTEDEIFF